jgi:diguanylate cyclase (GGDEF)-like protein/PAS domain S-box-containing protein
MRRIPRRLDKVKAKQGGGVQRKSKVRQTTRLTARETAEMARRRAQADEAINQAKRSHERLREAIELLPQGIVFLDSEGRYVLWNKKYAEIYKGSADLFETGARLQDTIRIGVARGDYPEAAGREEEWIAERLAKLSQPGERHEQWLADGRCILIEERKTNDGGVIGLRVDITELKQREASFRLLFDGNPVPMIVCAMDDETILAVNDAAIEHYGYSRETFQAMTVRSIQAFQAEPPWMVEASEESSTGQIWKHIKADGSLIDVGIYSRQLVHEGRPAMLLSLIDNTERRQTEARLAFMAQHDALTGLANRNMFRKRVDDMLVGGRRNGLQTAVLCLDLDNFRAVNDLLGHATGDLLLRKVAKRLRSMLREEDGLARLGGDEFAVMQSGLARPEEASRLAKRLISSMNDPFLLDGQTVSITASIGIALAPGDGDDGDRLLKNADLALARAKQEVRGSFGFFEPGMDAEVQARRRTEVDLRTAIETGALQPYYQPLFDLMTGRITGMEALIRWPHPERGMISPGEFIPVAEETGLISTIGAMMLRRACADAATWPNEIRVAVNLSPLQFRTGNLFSTVTDALRAAGLPPQRLELEITETLLLEKSDQILATLHALRALSAELPVRQDQDRPVIHPRTRLQARCADHRPCHCRSRPGSWRDDHGGRRRDGRRTEFPAR